MKVFAVIALAALLTSGCGTQRSVRKGDAHLEAGRTSAALSAYEDALERSPDDPQVHLRMAQALLDRGEVERALTHARVAATADQEGSVEILGRALLLSGHPREALDLASEAVVSAPTPTRYLILAEAQLSTGDPAGALASSKRAAEGGTPEALSLRAYLLARNDRPARAIEQAAQAQVTAPKDPDVQAEVAVIYSMLGETAAAQSAAQEALYHNDGHAERWSQSADARRARGDVEGALRYGLRAYALAPEDATLAWSLGTWWLEVGEPRWAIDLLHRAINLPPYADPLAVLRDPELQKLSIQERREGRVQLALELAGAYSALGDRQRQIQSLQQAAEGGQDATILFQLARAYDQAGMATESLAAASAACRMDPGLTEAALMVTQVYGTAGLFGDALACALPALKSAPGHPVLSRMIAEIYEARGEYALSLETLEAALRRHPMDPSLKAARDRVAAKTRRPW